MADLPDPLPRWRDSYRGEVDLTGYPEGFLGDLRGEEREPRLIALGLNPGVAYPPLQGPNGDWTQAIRRLTYSRSSEHRVPYNNAAWRRRHRGRDSHYWVKIVNFARRWLREPQAGVADILNIEMFPFHSRRLIGAITPPKDIIESFVWKPLLEFNTAHVFAFGSDWDPVCADLLGSPTASYGSGWTSLSDATNGNWRINVYPLAEKRIFVSWQQGYAGPPGLGNIDELRRVVDEVSS
jgi:hypothetical protein